MMLADTDCCATDSICCDVVIDGSQCHMHNISSIVFSGVTSGAVSVIGIWGHYRHKCSSGGPFADLKRHRFRNGLHSVPKYNRIFLAS
ncbi:hypothetical protein TNCV_789531 [Trichonephila clavipes]|nr:hypothetical protein TNCV_789531 [Trichonephila clavipes]